MAGARENRLSGLPDLFRELMDRPLRPLTRARLPERSAVYLFYQGPEPVHVGSPPHLEELGLLASSVRLSQSVRAIRESGAVSTTLRLGPVRDSVEGRRPPIAARWLPVADDQERMLLELYAAQALGLSVSHPRIKAGLTG